MSDHELSRRPTRILLSGVFGPFGVDDRWGRKENIMELFHNQVTRGQGAFSFRFHHRSFGLYFLAANVDADVTVLDFPSRRRFRRELRRGYDVVGISFIAPNFVKAREMARLTREISPSATIILGGHGAAIDGVEDLIDCDHVVRGEGIAWLRRFLGQDPDAPVVHPVLPSTERQSIVGVPVPGPTASLLVPGVGCVNGCSFCCTSHFFGRAYTPFLATGRDLFHTACRIAETRGTDTFFVMDENFLKDRERALELLAEMEREERFFRFHIFSSAEAISAFGVDNLVRLGVEFVWIGLESTSRRDAFAKNHDLDAAGLVRALRDRGISVLASGILCMEHHTPANMQQDVDFLVGVDADFVQFMLLTPMPVTRLYRDQQRRGLLRDDLPLEEWHGQKELAYRHPAFGPGEPARWLEAAFRQDYEVNSSSMYRVVETALRGVRTLAAMADRDPCLEARLADRIRRAREYGPMLAAVARYAVNDKERQRARRLEAELVETLGPWTAVERVKRAAVTALAAGWKLRLGLLGDSIQPRTIATRYPARAGSVRRVPVAIRMGEAGRDGLDAGGRAAAMVALGPEPAVARDQG
jgi:hypothetical protein